MKLNKHFSSFVDHLMLKTPRALHQFMHASNLQRTPTYFLLAAIFLLNDFIASILSTTVCVLPINCIYRGFIVRFQADELLLFFKNHILRPMVNLCKLLSPGNQAELNLKSTLSSKVNRFVGKGFILDK